MKGSERCGNTEEEKRNKGKGREGKGNDQTEGGGIATLASSPLRCRMLHNTVTSFALSLAMSVRRNFLRTCTRYSTLTLSSLEELLNSLCLTRDISRSLMLHFNEAICDTMEENRKKKLCGEA